MRRLHAISNWIRERRMRRQLRIAKRAVHSAMGIWYRMDDPKLNRFLVGAGLQLELCLAYLRKL